MWSKPSFVQRPVLPNVSWDCKQATHCLREVWHSLLKWVRGESQKEHALTTCDPHLNSFQHDISLNQAFQKAALCRLMWTGLNNGHCAAWSWSKKAKAGWSYNSSINGNGPLSKFPAEIITQGEAQDEVIPLWFSKDIILGTLHVWLKDDGYHPGKRIQS